jgi:hypothetical protein
MIFLAEKDHQLLKSHFNLNTTDTPEVYRFVSMLLINPIKFQGKKILIRASTFMIIR